MIKRSIRVNILPVDPSELFPFQLDDFQLEAMRHLDDGKSVVVCAPTGSGKTVVAEYAVELALRNGQRCFYTTPLKALSNQKFGDLKAKHGEARVGLLTGDVSINRDADVVVMTTEVFRNMLYGTTLGDVYKNLERVNFVVLDECHYMNDAERGTVWEESIIYCPADIQLVALSATVANSQELTEWIDQTHGPTELVVSSYRPVPLRFYFFGQGRIFPLFSPGGQMNSQLKQPFGRKRGQQARSRRHRQDLIPDPRDVIGTLAAREMLPAIYFLFSRRGCEESMRKAQALDLLTGREKQELKRIIDDLTREHPNLANHPHLEGLYRGMAVHHAGMLPSWKSLVEKLFQKNLLKAVFATETLAAGINMPARTTIISSISKRSDEGHRNLTASEFLQMSGRAGRRGMDEVGHVVVLSQPFAFVEDAARLATAPPDPLSSRFTPSYGMVLNLLQRHTLAEAQDLIERSFGQFVVSKELEPAFEQVLTWEQELATLRQPLCPGEIGDLRLYKRRLETHHAKSRQVRAMERGLETQSQGGPRGQHSRGGQVPLSAGGYEGQAEIEAVRSEIKELLDLSYAMPCHGCPVQKPCSKQEDRVRTLSLRVKDMRHRIDQETNRTWRLFESLANILRMHGYLDGDVPSKIGQMAAALRGSNELFLAEVALGKVLEELTPVECAAVLTILISEDARGEDLVLIPVAPHVDAACAKLRKVARRIVQSQRDFNVTIPIEFSLSQAGLTQMWAEGADWQDVRHATPHDEGDVVRTLRRTVDLARQFGRAPHMPDPVAQVCIETERLLARDEVREQN